MGSKNKDRFSSSQVWAIWTAYGMKCFWCKKVLDFTECEVDHVIPKSTSKIVLNSLIKDNNLGADFALSSCANWVAACGPCSKKRAKGQLKLASDLPSWFNIIRNKIPLVEGKIRQIDGDQTLKLQLQELVAKVEKGEVSREFAERVAGPFLRSVEGSPNSNVEFRLGKTTRLFYGPEGLRLQPPSEIQYEKFVDRMVEGGEWKKKGVEQLREGPRFGEGRPRRPGSGA